MTPTSQKANVEPNYNRSPIAIIAGLGSCLSRYSHPVQHILVDLRWQYGKMYRFRIPKTSINDSHHHSL